MNGNMIILSINVDTIHHLNAKNEVSGQPSSCLEPLCQLNDPFLIVPISFY